jgi:hypothetical protein
MAGETVTGSDDDKELQGWIDELAAAELGASMLPRQSFIIYQINYRVSTSKSAVKGDDSRRRRRLEALLGSLKPDHHISTTTWRAELHIPRAAKVAELLGKPLDLELDSIHVTEATTNRIFHGVPTIKP